MSRFTRGLLLLIISAAASTAYDENDCLEGYQPVSSNSQLCFMVTPPGTWLEAFTMCTLPENKFFDPTLEMENNVDEIHSRLRQLGIYEVWLRPSDYRSLNNVVAQNSVSLVDEFFYSYHISRWKWSTSPTNECETFSLRTLNHSARSCSPEDSQKLPFVCFLYVGQSALHEAPMVPFSQGCSNGTFQGFRYDESDTCYQLEDNLTETLAGKDYPYAGLKGENHSHCDWLANGINQTELERRIDDLCQSLSSRETTTYSTFQPYHGNNNTMVQTGAAFGLTGYKPKKSRNVFKRIWDQVKNTTRKIIGLTKREVPLKWSRLVLSSGYGCMLCAPDVLPPQLLLQLNGPDVSCVRKNDRLSRLSLTLLNYNSHEIEEVTCYTDASLSNFTLPNFKMSKISISPLNMQTHTRELTRHHIAIEDSFFLRFQNNSSIHSPVKNLGWETELIEFNEGHNHSTTFITIPFDVAEEGNYWCVGRDYITNRPIFTESVFVETPLDAKLERYLILVEAPRRYDPISYCQKFGIIIARNLNISDANMELKRITSTEHSHLLLYHITSLQRNSHFLVRTVPKVFQFYFEKTSKGFANITSISKISSVCPTSSMNSSQGFAVNLTSTLKGGRPVVVPAYINGYIVNAAYACVGDAVYGAVWKEITPEDKKWKKEWQPSLRVGSMTFLDLHKMSNNPIDSNQLPDVTDRVKVLLNQGTGSAAGNGRALEDFDRILSSLLFDPNGNGVVKDVRHSELAVLVSDLSRKDPVVGISMTTKNGIDTIEGISATQSQPSEDSEVFVRLPSTITRNYKRLAFAVISNVQSFQSNTTNLRVNSHIVDIILSNPEKIPDHTKLPNGQVVEIYFKPTSKVLGTESVSCAFWDLQNAAWSTEGCTLDRSSNVCRCNHLTHFAQIITGSGSRLSAGHQKALEAISITGCILSLLGLLVIVATGIVFKAWRKDIGNQVLLNLTAALTLNLVTYLLVHSGVGGNEGGGCIFIGIILHYSVLACFCWMLVMSGLQLVRLLTIVGNRNTSKLLLKSCLFAWGVPFIPIAILLIIGPSLYASTTDNSIERGFCYPTGVAFYTTVLAPVVCIIIVNLVAYIAILFRLFSCCGWGELKTGIQRHGLSDGVIAMRRVRILVFLFFLFGLTWTFAFLAKYIFFAYLFCITATLQGFVIFIFFFVIERKSRGYWKAEFCQTSGKKNYKSAETLSSVTYSTGTHKTSGSKSSWYVESTPLQNKGNGSAGLIRRKEESVASLSQEEEPLKLRYSQQNMSPAEGFPEVYVDLAPLKRISFEVDEILEHKSVIPQIKSLKDLTPPDTKTQYENITETVNESPKAQLSFEVIKPNPSEIKKYTIEQDPVRKGYEDSPNGTGQCEENAIIPEAKAFNGSTLQEVSNSHQEILANKTESPKTSLIGEKTPNFPEDKDAITTHTSTKELESVPSFPEASSTRESPKATVKILQQSDRSLPATNVTIVRVESGSGYNHDNREQVVSANKPTSHLPPQNQVSTHNAPSSQVPREETLTSVISVKKDPTVLAPTIASRPQNQVSTHNAQSSQVPMEETLTSVISVKKDPTVLAPTIASSDNKAVGQTNPTKRSPFVAVCPITRH